MVIPRNQVTRRRRRPSSFLPIRLVAAVTITSVFLVTDVMRPKLFSDAYLPPHNPPWPPTYNVTESLITMQCNSSGYSNVNRAAEFGIVSYDWSNAKAQWSKNRPMDCEERLFEQAEQLATTKKARNNGSTNSHIFVYRNLVKALPWFSTVRTKLVDPAYQGFFLKFEERNISRAYRVPRCAPEDPSVCSDLYHDQEQTPQVPTPDHQHPDGECDGTCDCGPGLPCGEYYFDHRNGTMLRDWLVRDVILASLAETNSSRIVDGFFLDDYWCSDLLCVQSNNTIAGCPCNDPNQGPTESNPYAVQDMGLLDEDVMEITLEWNKTMDLVERTLLEHGAYTWWLMDRQENANAGPYLFALDLGLDDVSANGTTNNDNKKSRNGITASPQIRSERCSKILEEACQEDSDWQVRPRLFGFSINATSNNSLLQFDLDWAFFLLVRGPYSWAGWGQWGMTWPFQSEPAHGTVRPLPNGVELPIPLTPEGAKDYGTPLGVCYKSSPGVFRREWSKGWTVEIDCKTDLSAANDGSEILSQIVFAGNTIADRIIEEEEDVMTFQRW